MGRRQKEQEQLQQIFLPNHAAGVEFISILPHRDPSPWPLSWSFLLSITAAKQTKITSGVPEVTVKKHLKKIQGNV